MLVFVAWPINPTETNVANNKTFSLDPILCLILSSGLFAAPCSFAQDTAVVPRSAYFDMAALYDSLSFDVGPLTTIESPNSDRYRDLIVASHNGRIRLGTMSDYDPMPGYQHADAKNAKIRVADRLVAEQEAYLGLLALQFGAHHFSSENLLYRDPVSGKQNKLIGNLSVVGYARVLGGNLLLDEHYKTYFCNGRPDCGEAAVRRLIQFGPRQTGSFARQWAAGGDEFAARTAMEAFIATDLQPLVDWSKSMPREIAVVGMTLMPEYDFARKGFAFQIGLPMDSSPRSNNLGYLYYERPDTEVGVVSADLYSSMLFLPVPPGDAEALLEDLKKRNSSPRLYFSLEGRVFNVDMEETSKRLGNRFRLLYELSSPTAVFYKDLGLTEEVGRADLSAQ